MKLRRSSSNDQPDAAPVATDAAATAPVTNDATAALAMQAADVQNARFHTARKGYHKGEVDDFLDRVEAAIEAKNARIAELEALTTAAAPAAAPVAAAPAAAAPAAAVPAAAAPVATPTPAETYPAQQVAQPAAAQAAPAFGVPDTLRAEVPEQTPAAAPAAPAAAPAAAQAVAGDGDGSFAAGWYADPWSQATYRYYDGSDWTAQTR